MYRDFSQLTGVHPVIYFCRYVSSLKNSPLCPYDTYAYTFVCAFQYKCNTPTYLVVITQVIPHPVTGHQGLPCVHAKLTNAISNTCTLSWVYHTYIGLMMISKNVKCQILSLVTTPTLVSITPILSTYGDRVFLIVSSCHRLQVC